ncbi:MAG TPA: GtrA family protein [Chthoniobacterales bacterium]
MESSKQALSRDTAKVARCFPDSLQAWWKRWHEFGRYVFFGGLNTVLTYVIYLVCLRFMTYRIAYTVSFVCGILISYFFNAQFVFKKELRMTKALQFSLVYLVQYFVGLGLLFILVEVAHLSKVFAPVLLVFLIVPTNYGLNRRVIKGGSASSRSR